MSTRKYPYEENAERATVTGFICRGCGQFWGEDEHMARYCCCASRKCEGCDNRTQTGRNQCSECNRKRTEQHYREMEVAAPSLPLSVMDDDKYFFSEDEIVEYCFDHLIHPTKLLLTNCEPVKPTFFDANDFWADELHEDSHLEADDLNKIVNDWAEANFPGHYYPDDNRPSDADLLAFIGWDEDTEQKFQATLAESKEQDN